MFCPSDLMKFTLKIATIMISDTLKVENIFQKYFYIPFVKVSVDFFSLFGYLFILSIDGGIPF